MPPSMSFVRASPRRSTMDGEVEALRREVEDQRRQQQERFAPAAMTAPPHTADDVRSQISAQVFIGEACIRSVGADERDGEGLR